MTEKPQSGAKPMAQAPRTNEQANTRPAAPPPVTDRAPPPPAKDD
jgi:hypothetical protein